MTTLIRKSLMSDLQCSKFSYGGQRFRILGKISQTVQTITNGMISGTVHIRTSVVEGLRDVFDSHGIVGKKFSELLPRKVSHTTPPNLPPILLSLLSPLSSLMSLLSSLMSLLSSLLSPLSSLSSLILRLSSLMLPLSSHMSPLSSLLSLLSHVSSLLSHL